MKFADVKNDIAFRKINVDDKGLLSAYEEANQQTWTQEELDAYDYADMREEDGRAKMDFAIKKARAEAVARAEKEKREMILEMYAEGMTIKQIAKITKKTEEEIREIIG